MLQTGSFSLNDFIQIFTDEEVSQTFVRQVLYFVILLFYYSKTINILINCNWY